MVEAMTEQRLSQNPIFIAGCPRSGTTLLQALIASQGDLITFPETHFFGSALNLGILERDTYSKNEAISIINGMNKVGQLNLDHKILNQLDQDFNYGQIRQKDLFELVIKAQALIDISPDKRWMEKTPSNGLCLDRIWHLYPDAQFVGIVREPFNAIHSILRNFPPEKGDKHEIIAKFWAQNQKKILDFAKKNPQKILIAKYENLAKQPQETIKDICNFLNLNFSVDKIYVSQETKKKIVKDFESWKSSITDEIVNNNINANKLFNTKEILKIQKAIYPLNTVLGYKMYYKNLQKIYNLITK